MYSVWEIIHEKKKKKLIIKEIDIFIGNTVLEISGVDDAQGWTLRHLLDIYRLELG